MKNINLIKHFRNVENIKKKRLARKKRNDERLLKNRGYRDFIAKVKSKKRSDDDYLGQVEFLYLNSLA
ncbi:hypothetical protein EC565_07945 [Helicobacter pylori]|uniref:hypothetical protein n=1 Tax=Helicobacter pylori TaxID=210 RepID=UPI000FDDBF18|nr:hypothetical protein [Helicobacter pylori]RVZ56216.1 hypothetical protein EC565_07945 [Helicobacter pylori]